MLVHHLLASFAVDDNRKIVKGFDNSTDLEAIGQIYRNRDAVFAKLVQKRILNID
ncbi:hypothetical protein D3C85_1900090 [compost metagenome]